MDDRNTRCAVIVPYFQRERGPLRRAIGSVASQVGVDHIQLKVVVVDDGSPVPATEECAHASLPFELDILRQQNGGPGAARNAGLDHVESWADFIAFLDSDDEWEPDHLATALATLDCELDFFFANHFQLGSDVPAFERAGKLRLDLHQSIGPDSYRYLGDMTRQILTGNIIGTSTVVYRTCDQLRSLRFEPRFRRAGEDYLMWLAIAQSGASIGFRSNSSVRYGQGVNIYAGVQWGTAAYIERTADEIKYLQTTLDRFVLDPSLIAEVRGRIGQLRRALVRALPSALVHDTRRSLGSLGRVIYALVG